MGNCCQERKEIIKQEEVKEDYQDEPLTFANRNLTVKNPKNIHEVYDLTLLTKIQQFKNLVYDAVHQKSKTKFIAKQIKKEDNLKKILGTIDILSLCDHQNIAKTIEYFENEEEI